MEIINMMSFCWHNPHTHGLRVNYTIKPAIKNSASHGLKPCEARFPFTGVLLSEPHYCSAVPNPPLLEALKGGMWSTVALVGP